MAQTTLKNAINKHISPASNSIYFTSIMNTKISIQRFCSVVSEDQ